MTTSARERVIQRFAALNGIWLVLICATLGLAPFTPEPHLWEKIQMLAAGELRLPLDWFDLLLHSAPWLLLGAWLMLK